MVKLIKKLNPWGYTLHGAVYWDGDEADDKGRIVISDAANTVETWGADIVYDNPVNRTAFLTVTPLELCLICGGAEVTTPTIHPFSLTRTGSHEFISVLPAQIAYTGSQP